MVGNMTNCQVKSACIIYTLAKIIPQFSAILTGSLQIEGEYKTV